MKKRRCQADQNEAPDLAREGACRSTPETKVIWSRRAFCVITETRGQVVHITKEPAGHQVR